MQSPGPGDAVHFSYQELIMFPELPALAVTDIAVTVREFVQPLEGGGMDSEVNRVIRNRSDHFARIAVIDSVFVCDNLIVRLDFADDAHISLNTLL
jgi:hypothetical protein